MIANCKWISGIAIHPKGDNLLVSSYDKKMMWFDLDLSTKPYQTLKLHSSAIRSIAFHLRYPLFASVSDDRDVIVSHGMVYKWVTEEKKSLNSENWLINFFYFPQWFVAESIDCATKTFAISWTSWWFWCLWCAVPSNTTMDILFWCWSNYSTLFIGFS